MKHSIYIDGWDEAAFIDGSDHGHPCVGRETTPSGDRPGNPTHRSDPALHRSRSLVSGDAGAQVRPPSVRDGYAYSRRMRADKDEDVT